MERQKGIVYTILLVIVGIVILGYFGLDLEEVIKSEQVQKNLNFAWSKILLAWNDYVDPGFNVIVEKAIVLGDKAVGMAKDLFGAIKLSS